MSESPAGAGADRLSEQLVGRLNAWRLDAPALAFLLAHRFLQLVAACDVARDAQNPHDGARVVAHGGFAGGNPRDAPIRPGLFFHEADHGCTGADDLLLIVARLGGMLGAEEIRIALADRFMRMIELESGGQ